jgi:hypothetical protein
MQQRRRCSKSRSKPQGSMSCNNLQPIATRHDVLQHNTQRIAKQCCSAVQHVAGQHNILRGDVTQVQRSCNMLHSLQPSAMCCMQYTSEALRENRLQFMRQSWPVR